MVVTILGNTQMLADDCFFFKDVKSKKHPYQQVFLKKKSFKFVGPMQILHFLGWIL